MCLFRSVCVLEVSVVLLFLYLSLSDGNDHAFREAYYAHIISHSVLLPLRCERPQLRHLVSMATLCSTQWRWVWCGKKKGGGSRCSMD